MNSSFKIKSSVFHSFSIGQDFTFSWVRSYIKVEGLSIILVNYLITQFGVYSLYLLWRNTTVDETGISKAILFAFSRQDRMCTLFGFKEIISNYCWA